MKKYCNENAIIFKDIGKLKHDFGRINKHVTIKNSYRLNILIEKIYILLNHSLSENIVFIDIDNVIQRNIPLQIFNNSNIILSEKEDNNLLNIRNLKNAFDEININIDNTTPSYNSGFIYIPSKDRKIIAQEVINMIIYMNKYDDKKRIAKDLDEQIALSAIAYKYYKNNIKTMNAYTKHFWSDVMNNINYWEK
tara:strand:+ start:271 stop:852 length:582 start_codon:yes stop_codon:yes gene_type:complete